jgi:hypothetical protein
MGGQAVDRMLPSLPYIHRVPVDGGLRVRLDDCPHRAGGR